eukprot:2781923-Rhodomonas_salina.1
MRVFALDVANAVCGVGHFDSRAHSLRNQRQGTAFLVQIILTVCGFCLFDSGACRLRRSGAEMSEIRPRYWAPYRFTRRATQIVDPLSPYEIYNAPLSSHAMRYDFHSTNVWTAATCTILCYVL